MPDPQFCLLGLNHWSICLTKGEWASWIQAVGSIAGIFFAGWFAARQFEKAQEAAAAARLDQLENWMLLLHGAGEKTRECRLKGTLGDLKRDWVISYFSEMRTMAQAVSRLDMTALENYEVVEPAVAGLSAMHIVIAHTEVALATNLAVRDGQALANAIGDLGDQMNIRSGTLRQIIDKKRA